jgi:hypothetical protein
MHRHQMVALALTIATEGAGMLAFSLSVRSQMRRAFYNLAVTVIANLATHTLFWNLFPLVTGYSFTALLIAEGLVSVVEGIVFRLACGIPIGVALALSAGLNATSWWGGGCIFQMLLL